jgi:hypothetical protein
VRGERGKLSRKKGAGKRKGSDVADPHAQELETTRTSRGRDDGLVGRRRVVGGAHDGEGERSSRVSALLVEET